MRASWLRLGVIIVSTGLAVGSIGCSNGSDSSPPVATTGVTPAIQGAPQITSVINHGLQADGRLQVEMLGTFPSGGSNTPVAVCGNNYPALTKRLDSTNRIVVSLPQVADSCSFFIYNGSTTSPYSRPVSFVAASGQATLQINSARVANTNTKVASRVSGRLDIVLGGSFYGYNDDVWAMCDGGSYVEIENTYVQLDSTTELRLSIATPVNFNSCQFYVEYGSYQSPSYSQVDVTSVSYVHSDPYYSDYSDFQLAGRWYEEPEIYVSCDNHDFVHIAQTNIYDWNGNSTSFRMVSRESYTSCEAYAYSQGSWSDIIYF